MLSGGLGGGRQGTDFFAGLLDNLFTATTAASHQTQPTRPNHANNHAVFSGSPRPPAPIGQE